MSFLRGVPDQAHCPVSVVVADGEEVTPFGEVLDDLPADDVALAGHHLWRIMDSATRGDDATEDGDSVLLCTSCDSGIVDRLRFGQGEEGLLGTEQPVRVCGEGHDDPLLLFTEEVEGAAEAVVDGDSAHLQRERKKGD